jgi:predicted permease
VIYPAFFQTLRIPLMSGRDFNVGDGVAAPRVAIVNVTAAERFWPGREAVGQVIQFAGENKPVQIVGVVRTASYDEPGEAPQAMIYLSTLQYYFPFGALYVRAAGDPAVALSAVQREIHSIEPGLFLDPQTASALVSKTLWAQNLSATLLSAFGVLALALASMGIYGVTSYAVSLRTREIGVRVAVGAAPGDVLRMVMRESALLVAGGVALGLAAALVLSRLVESMLVGVTSHDTVTFVAAPCVLALAAMAACWIPARRAARIDPSRALRAE